MNSSEAFLGSCWRGSPGRGVGVFFRMGECRKTKLKRATGLYERERERERESGRNTETKRNDEEGGRRNGVCGFCGGRSFFFGGRTRLHSRHVAVMAAMMTMITRRDDGRLGSTRPRTAASSRPNELSRRRRNGHRVPRKNGE